MHFPTIVVMSGELALGMRIHPCELSERRLADGSRTRSGRHVVGQKPYTGLTALTLSLITDEVRRRNLPGDWPSEW